MKKAVIAVVGAGNMGSGIAQKYAAEGFEVLLLDVDAPALERGVSRIEAMLAEGVERRVYRPDEAKALRDRIRPTLDWETVAGAMVVIEAVFEDLKVKKEVFERLSRITGPETVLATNTSSFFVRDLKESVRHPDRLMGLHYFYHPAKNRLVEVIPGPSTRPDLLQSVWNLQEEIGKTPIRCADAPGFIVNRFFVPWINEAARMLDEGVGSIATIEQAAKEAFGIGMGPFELMNVTGIVIGYHAAETLHRQLGAFYAPAKGLGELKDSGAQYAVTGDPDPAGYPAVAARLQGVAFHLAAALVEEGVGAPEDVDIGARVGLRWRQGPFEMMNRVGTREAARLAAEIESRWKLPVPRILREAAETGRAFDLKVVTLDVDDGVGTITIRRPDAMNALNETVVEQLAQRLEEAYADPQVRGIVIAGSGKAFVAGADVRFFVKQIEAGKLDRIRSFTERGHALLHRIEDGPKPVVARLHGLALGGGFELALACDHIVATPKAVVAFPETGIGIYPGLGGTARTARRIGVPLTRWLVLTGSMTDAATAAAMGLVDEVVPHEKLQESLRARIEMGKAASGRAGTAAVPPLAADAPENIRTAASVFGGLDLDAAIAGTVEVPPILSRAVGGLAKKAPLALALADRLIREGAGLPLDGALAAELAALETIFATKDAYEGLSSLGKKAPVFEGR